MEFLHSPCKLHETIVDLRQMLDEAAKSIITKLMPAQRGTD